MFLLGLQHDFPDRATSWFTVEFLSSAMTLSVGIGPLFAVPLSTAIGRRPVILMTSATMAVMVLWAGLTKDYWLLLVATCFQGISVGSTLSMCLLMTMDGTFIHERPYALSIFWASGALVLSTFIMIFPFVIDVETQWRPVYQVWFGPCVLVFFLVLLFIPETYFIRPPIAFNGQVLVQSSSEKIEIYQNWEAVPCGPHCPHNSHTHEASGPSSWMKRLQVRRAPGTSWKGAAAIYVQMALCLTNPLLVWVSLLSAAILSGVIFTNLTLPNNLVQTVSPADQRLVGVWLGISCLAACFLSIPTTGPLITWCTKRYTLRCGGTRHAEAYLSGFVFPVLSSVLSIGLFCLAKSNHWPPGVSVFAFGLSTFSYITTNVATVLWISEAFPPWAAASLAVQMFTCNVVAFGVGINLLSWIKVDETLLPSIIIIVLVLVLGAFALPIAFWGKTVRQYIHGRWSESEKGAIRPS
ncbi:hypothetical protein ACHAQA_004704 [Verticillium albo-atrum]